MKHLKRKMIIDTDLACDADDAIALALACILHKRGITEISGVTHSLASKDAAKMVSVITERYDLTFPIGYAQYSALNAPDYFNRFLNAMIKRNRNPYPNYFSAEELIVNELKNAEDKSVTLVCIGQLNNLASVLKSEGGYELIDKKAEKIVIMGGNFADYGEKYFYGKCYWQGEFNIISDIQSSAAVFDCSRLPLYIIDFNQGIDAEFVIAESGLSEKNIVREIFEVARFDSRPMWDPITVAFASGIWSELYDVSESGRVVLNENGKTRFVYGEGNCRLVTVNDKRKFKQRIYEIMREHDYEKNA